MKTLRARARQTILEVQLGNSCKAESRARRPKSPRLAKRRRRRGAKGVQAQRERKTWKKLSRMSMALRRWRALRLRSRKQTGCSPKIWESGRLKPKPDERILEKLLRARGRVRASVCVRARHVRVTVTFRCEVPRCTTRCREKDLWRSAFLAIRRRFSNYRPPAENSKSP